jgi:hypothetical protein
MDASQNSTSLTNTARPTVASTARRPPRFARQAEDRLTPLCGNITPCAFHCIAMGAAQNRSTQSVNYGETKNYGENRNARETIGTPLS